MIFSYKLWIIHTDFARKYLKRSQKSAKILTTLALTSESPGAAGQPAGDVERKPMCRCPYLHDNDCFPNVTTKSGDK